MQTYKTKDGFVLRGRSDFVQKFKEVSDEMDKAERAWVAGLKSRGIKAAHPNDGWVDRKGKSFVLVYPQFNAGVSIGDKVALGDYRKETIVTVTKIEHNRLGGAPRYYYE